MRDKRVYEEGLKFLLDSSKLTFADLAAYLSPPNEPRTLSFDEIYENMLLSATNVGMNINTIKKHPGHEWGDSRQKEEWARTKAKLNAFSAVKIIETYGNDPNNWNKVWQAIKPISIEPPRTVKRFCQTVISAANFITQFQSEDQFYEWIELFDNNIQARAALPMLLAYEVQGFGFALACDFVKGLGYNNFPKPDIHLETICKGLALCPQDANMYQVYKTIIRVSANAGVTPFCFDKVFFLIGSGDLSDPDHIQAKRNMAAISNRRETFIQDMREILQSENLL